MNTSAHKMFSRKTLKIHAAEKNKHDFKVV